MSRYIKIPIVIIGLVIGATLGSACAVPISGESTGVQRAIPRVATPTHAPPPSSPTRGRVYSITIPTATSAPTAVPTTTNVQTSTVTVPVYGYKVIASYPHDQEAYTEGLQIENGELYEGTGINGQSTLRKVDLKTGKVLQSVPLEEHYYGEGITLFGDQIFQLTWQSHVGFVYNKQTFQQLATFPYPTEGWGLTHDDTRLIMSDGTPTLYFLDPQTLQATGQVTVTDAGEPVHNINELEYIKGEVYANIWKTDRIARIDPSTGKVIGWIDLTGLLAPEERPRSSEGVLNGIAYDADHNRLFVTGKYWPKLFEIELVPPS